MDWSNETYVRVYVRETDDDLALSWEAIALWNQLMKRFDRSGVVQTKRGVRGLAALVRIPVEVVERALPELLEDGRLKQVDGGYVAPNFVEAQEARKSDKLRQKELRDRRRSDSLTVTPRDGAVTIRDGNVTAGHTASHGVTLCSALQSNANQRELARTHAIVPSTEQTPSTLPSQEQTEQTRQTARRGLIEINWDAWTYARLRYDEIGSLGPNDKPRPGVWTGNPTGIGSNQLTERTRELAARSTPTDWDAVEETHRNVVECNVERARILGHRGYMVPSRIYEHESFHRFVDLSPAQVRALESAKASAALANGSRTDRAPAKELTNLAGALDLGPTDAPRGTR